MLYELLSPSVTSNCVSCAESVAHLTLTENLAVATLVQAFVTSRIDNCNGLLSGVPKAVTDKLQRAMNSAACIVSNTRKFDHGLTHVRHDILGTCESFFFVRIEFRIESAVYHPRKP